MVQSIWLDFDPSQLNNDNINKIKQIVKRRYKSYSYLSATLKNTFNFKFIDQSQFKDILEQLNIEVDDSKPCTCGCLSTDFEMMVFFLALEFSYGKISDHLSHIYFQLGRNITTSVGLYHARLNVLKYMLESIKEDCEKEGIKSKLNLNDCDSDDLKTR